MPDAPKPEDKRKYIVEEFATTQMTFAHNMLRFAEGIDAILKRHDQDKKHSPLNDREVAFLKEMKMHANNCGTSLQDGVKILNAKTDEKRMELFCQLSEQEMRLENDLQFFVNHEQQLQDLIDKEKFKNFYKKEMDTINRACKVSAASVIIQPVQRLPRVNLLAMDLLNKTDRNHDSYKQLESCLAKVEGMNVRMEEKGKAFEEAQKKGDHFEIPVAIISILRKIEKPLKDEKLYQVLKIPVAEAKKTAHKLHGSLSSVLSRLTDGDNKRLSQLVERSKKHGAWSMKLNQAMNSYLNMNKDFKDVNFLRSQLETFRAIVSDARHIKVGRKDVEFIKAKLIVDTLELNLKKLEASNQKALKSDVRVDSPKTGQKK